MGVDVGVLNKRRVAGELVGDVEVTGKPLIATRIDADEVPRLVDEVPLVALLAAFAHGTTVIRGAEELRAKESDRIDAVTTGLRGIGVWIEARDDGFSRAWDAGAASRRTYRRARRSPDRDARRCRRRGFPRRRGDRWRRQRRGKLPRLLRPARLSSATMIVAIDGPAGAGKSTVARALAKRLNFRYLDTGAMYRSLTWLALRDGVRLEDGAALGALAHAHPVMFDEAGHVFIAGEDITAEIRQVGVDRTVPVVAAHPEVREVMRERQRELAAEGNAVIEGRDIGTVVAPNAEVKVYLVADPSVRAQRRQAERPEIGGEALATDLQLRDESDRERMQRADDAQEIDTTISTWTT